MKTIRIPVVVYELLLEKSKKSKFRSLEDYLDALARSKDVIIKQMGSINIRFEDEYPRQTTYRVKFVNLIKRLISEEPDLLGTSFTLSTNGKGGKNVSYKYKSGRFQTEKIDELDECSYYLSEMQSIQFNYPTLD